MPHDRISLIVYKHPEFSTSTIGSRDKDEGLLVDGDGYVSLPVVDEVHIAGLTQKEARKKIEDAFSNYLKYSKVKLEVLNKRAYIVGEVKNPGEYKLQNEKTSLLKIIAKAGDMKDSANKKNILILRNQGNDTEVTRVDLTGKNSLYVASMMILPNDVVYVPPKGIKAYNSDIRDIEPTFRLISNMLTPFVNIKYLSN
jgi:polysaccharide export outer membrane protein